MPNPHKQCGQPDCISPCPALMLDYNASNPVNPAWSRTLASLVEEWKLHNFAYYLGFKQERTGDCDFNNADEGMGLWDFVGR